MRFQVLLSQDAEADLLQIFDFISAEASTARADAYINRILGFLASMDVFPERGTVRNDIRPNLRIVGFERRVSIAFVVEDHDVVIVRILYGGRSISLSEA